MRGISGSPTTDAADGAEEPLPQSLAKTITRYQSKQPPGRAEDEQQQKREVVKETNDESVHLRVVTGKSGLDDLRPR